MLDHYLTLAGRTFRRQPISTAVSVLTLSLGLVAFMTAYAVVLHWQRSDAQFENIDRTYVITPSLTFNEGEVRTGRFTSTNEFYAKYLKTDFPQLEAVARAFGFPDVSAANGDRSIRLYRMIVDAEFLEIFDLPFLSGDSRRALSQPRSVVLTKATATRLFGDEDPMGKRVTLASHVDTTVTGVVDELPHASHLHNVELYASWDVWDAIRATRNPSYANPPENWFGGYCCTTYVLLPEDGSLTPASFLHGLEGFAARRLSADELRTSSFTVGAVPLSQYIATSLNGVLGSANEYISITGVLMLLGGLILAVACINYANLSTARAARRAKEVGLRKALGATRFQVAAQYLFESAVLVSAAMILAAVLLAAARPVLQSSVDIDLLPTALSSVQFYVFLLVLAGAVTLCAGAYPALILSAVPPVEAIRIGQLRGGPRRLSRFLVGTQFLVAAFLLVAVFVMYSQNYELKRTGLGRISDPFLVIDNASALSGVPSETLVTELQNLPQVTAVTQAGEAPWGSAFSLGVLARSPEDGAATHSAYANLVGLEYFSAFDIETLAGRVFDADHDDASPSTRAEVNVNKPISVVVERTLAHDLGFETPEAAVGQIVYYPRGPEMGPMGGQMIRIIGVVADTPMHLYSGGIDSNFFVTSNVLEKVIVRISRDDVPGALAAIDATWAKLKPGFPLSRKFLDEVFDESYKIFSRINLLFTTLAAMAVFIAIVGLLGMAIQIANRRSHEIGIRKTVGARARDVVRMLLTDFTRPVVIANVIAWPLAYVAASAYLSLFMYRIDLTPIPFVASLFATTCIALLAVGRQAYSAASIRPADVLNHE